jgi:hypothetical protein
MQRQSCFLQRQSCFLQWQSCLCLQQSSTCLRHSSVNRQRQCHLSTALFNPSSNSLAFICGSHALLCSSQQSASSTTSCPRAHTNVSSSESPSLLFLDTPLP